MRYNLSKRLFVITLSVLLLLMGFTMLFQLFFFQSFYEEKRVTNLITQVNRFCNLNSYNFSDYDKCIRALNYFENNNNARIAIFDCKKNGDLSLKYITSPYNKDQTDEIDSLTSFCKELYNDSDLINDSMKKGKAEASLFYNQSSNTKKIGVLCPLSINTKNDSLVIAVSSIQPIEEASSVIGEFYIYIFIFFVFIAVLLSFIFSNIISKPLVKINDVAKKMTNLDFTAKCTIKRDDEIGNLALTLNFLSSNLKESLESLKAKNAQLEKDIEKERSLELMRKDFIASVSHELKTPIGIIEGYAEGIKDGVVSKDEFDLYLETIIDESKKMGTLVSNMLELSKLESGAITPKLKLFNINRLIKKVVRTQTNSAEDRNLNLIFNEMTEYSYVNADTFQMEEVLTNLITNAIKYTPENNDIIVTIKEINDNYELTVLNKGAHIDENKLDKLFDKFYRIDKSGERKTNSTGLGLSIVKNILEQHNLKYSLKNSSLGVLFTIIFPKAEYVEEMED